MSTKTLTPTKDQSKTDKKLKRPKKYSVIFHNDEYTPFEFVESILMEVFRKTRDESAAIAMEVHEKGAAVAGTYTKDIAETKFARANAIIQKSEHPLLLTLEQEQ